MSKGSWLNLLPGLVAAAAFCGFTCTVYKKEKPEARSVGRAAEKASSAPLPDQGAPEEGRTEGAGVPPAGTTENRVVLVSLDGMHTDLIRVMPTLQQMQKEGSWTLKADVPKGSTTEISHAALFTGVEPAKNGVDDHLSNKVREPTCTKECSSVHGVGFRWKPLRVEETLFTAVEKTAHAYAAVQKGKLVGLLRADGSEENIISTHRSRQVVSHGCKALEDPATSLVVLHLKMIDGAGHDAKTRGWLGPEQEEEASNVDADVGRIRDCIAETDAAVGRATTLIVTADHGGTPGEHNHYKLSEDTRLVPWIAVGPGIRAEHEIVGRSDVPPVVRGGTKPSMLLIDTVPTILRILGMPRASIPTLSPRALSVDEIFVSD